MKNTFVLLICLLAISKIEAQLLTGENVAVVATDAGKVRGYVPLITSDYLPG